MEKSVLFRPDQHVKATDFSNMQAYVTAAIDRLVKHGMDPGKKYIELAATETGPTEVTVEPGAFVSNGQVYIRETFTVWSLAAKLPAATQKIATVVVWGNTVEESIEPRSYLIDADANTFEVREVTMRETRALQMDIIYGAESASPQRGAIDSNTIAVADILLDSAGVVSVTMDTANKFVSIRENADGITELVDWRGEVSQEVDTLRTNLAKLKQQMPPDLTEQLMALASELAELRNEVRRTGVKSFVDRFQNTDDSDDAHAGYSARVEDGLTFPATTPARSAITLLNPLEPRVKTVDNITLPLYEEVTRLSIRKFNSYAVITSYPVVTLNWVRNHLSRRCIRYGDWLASSVAILGKGSSLSTLLAHSVAVTPGSDAALAELARRPDLYYFTALRASGEPYTIDWDRFWRNSKHLKHLIGHRKHRCHRDHFARAYWPAIVTTGTQAGASVCQTWLNASNGWMTSLRLFFRDKAATGDVKVLICETVNGIPDETKIISSGEILNASINTSSQGVRIPITPVYLEGGERYGIIVVSSTAHSLRVADDNRYTLGSLFYRADTNVWLRTDSADLCMEVNMARFSVTRTEIQFTSIERAGGISALRTMAALYVPPGTEATFEVQNGGIWRPLDVSEDDGDVDALNPVAALLPFRLVMTGTYDLMPGIDLTQSEIEAFVTDTALEHWSEQRSLGSDTTEIHVEYFINGWDAAAHSLDARVEVGGIESAAAGTIVTEANPEDPSKVKMTFKWTGLAALNAFKIKTTGSTTGGHFVIGERWDHAF